MVESAVEELEALHGDILKAGIAVGQMAEMVGSGEKSRRDLESFIAGLKKRLGGTGGG